MSLCAAIRISVISVMLDLNLIFLLLQIAYQYNNKATFTNVWKIT